MLSPVDVHIIVKANSRKDQLQRQGNTIIARVAARAVEGQANAHLIKVLAAFFCVSLSSFHLLKGERSPRKMVRVTADPDVISRLIQELPESPI
jgi:uncharacterized protein YggU (UPF0235/DUF167 family)